MAAIYTTTLSDADGRTYELGAESADEDLRDASSRALNGLQGDESFGSDLFVQQRSTSYEGGLM